MQPRPATQSLGGLKEEHISLERSSLPSSERSSPLNKNLEWARQRNKLGERRHGPLLCNSGHHASVMQQKWAEAKKIQAHDGGSIEPWSTE